MFREKLKTKKMLQNELGLEQSEDAFLVGIISRLTEQKGFDLLAYIMERALESDIQFVVLGTGEERFENMLRWFLREISDKGERKHNVFK